MLTRSVPTPTQPATRYRPSALRVAFVMEQTLGHVTHTRNLQDAFAQDASILPTWLPVPYERSGALGRIPALGANWTLRGSLTGGAKLLRARRQDRFDALFFHTQTVALLAPLVGWRLPVVISLDATPRNFDAVGRHYGHAVAGGRLEEAKRRAHQLVFRRAAALTTWSDWAKRSLRDDYAVDPDRVTVIPPGVDLDLFAVDRSGETPQNRPVRVLFVGGDFARKGGPDLLACMRAGLAEHCELHVVTRQPVPETPGVIVHTDLGPNDPRLLRLYQEADIFALPTHADCLAVVLGEAMAASLPVVTTTVGAQAEAVRDGETGLLIPDGDIAALAVALRRLAADPALRLRMGRAGRRLAEERFDARSNARRLLAVIADAVERWQAAAARKEIAPSTR